MKVIVSKIAQAEFQDARQYYEIEQSGLGRRFEKEVKAALLRIKKIPEAWPVEKGEIQKYLLHKFPFKILFSIQNDHILVLAFAHQHREPQYWISRSQD